MPLSFFQTFCEVQFWDLHLIPHHVLNCISTAIIDLGKARGDKEPNLDCVFGQTWMRCLPKKPCTKFEEYIYFNIGNMKVTHTEDDLILSHCWITPGESVHAYTVSSSLIALHSDCQFHTLSNHQSICYLEWALFLIYYNWENMWKLREFCYFFQDSRTVKRCSIDNYSYDIQ